MGFYLNTPVEQLSDKALLDQHRTCHSYIRQMGFLRTERFGDMWRKDVMVLHATTVREMLRRGMTHSAPLRVGPDYNEGSRKNEIAIVVKRGHPQMMEGKPCPLCTADSALEIVDKELRCRHCDQRFKSIKDPEHYGSPAT